jgi:hypothetical protein
MKARMSTDALIATLEANRAQHRVIFGEALEGWRREAIKWFNARVRALRNGDTGVGTYFNLTRPVDHTKDYDVALAMLHATEDDTLVLDENEFRQYVQDEWGWKKSWVVSNSMYSATAATLANKIDEDD